MDSKQFSDEIQRDIIKNVKVEESKNQESVQLTNFRLKNETPLNRGCLGIFSFCASPHPLGSCNSNGLPLTPNSGNLIMENVSNILMR